MGAVKAAPGPLLEAPGDAKPTFAGPPKGIATAKAPRIVENRQDCTAANFLRRRLLARPCGRVGSSLRELLASVLAFARSYG